jgi:glycosyltransferase involved in cell wall biosynthesis
LKISIIVPAFNEQKLITASLREIITASEAFRRRDWETELIVCDNNSTDRTAELARAKGATVVSEPVNQIARARNRGAQAATGDWLIFVDADTHPSAALFAEVAAHIQAGRTLAGGSTIKLESFHLLGSSITCFWNLISRTMKWAAGSFIFCQTEAFRAVGGFNQDLFASEEIDLSSRLKTLCRSRRMNFSIIHKHPITTSGRKVHLYSWREHLRFLSVAIAHPMRTVRNRESCSTWYDGRR